MEPDYRVKAKSITNLKNLEFALRSFLRRTRWKIIRRSAFIREFLMPISFGLNQLDFKLIEHLGNSEIVYVELGANDGVTQSNTMYFELFTSSWGLLIEPSESQFDQLIKNRSGNNKFENSACVSFDYSSKEIPLIYSNLMTTAANAQTELENPWLHAREGESFWGGKSFEFIAQARTLNHLMEKNEMPSKCDLLSLDVEGSELEVLKGLNHNQYRFRYILVETRNQDSMSNYLDSQGYELVTSLSHHDLLFRDKQ